MIKNLNRAILDNILRPPAVLINTVKNGRVRLAVGQHTSPVTNCLPDAGGDLPSLHLKLHVYGFFKELYRSVESATILDKIQWLSICEMVSTQTRLLGVIFAPNEEIL
jgi:hypothetical protein